MNTKLGLSGSENLPYTWEYSEMSYGPLKDAPLLAGDRLVCVTASVIFALDIYTGEQVGSPYYRRPSLSVPPPPAHSRGTLFFVDADELVARRLSDGKAPERIVDGRPQPAWTPPAVMNAVSVSAGDDVVAVVYRDDEQTRVEGFDPLSGKLAWGPVSVSQTSPGPVCATRDALVFVSGGRLFAVNIRSGDTRFDFSPAGVADPLSYESAPQAGEVGDASVVVAAGGAAVYGIDLRTGKQLWAHRTEHPSRNTQWLTPAVAERYNRVALANTEGGLYVVELTTGVPQWSVQLTDIGQVQVVGDKVYAFSEGGARLHVYELASEKRSYEVRVEDVGTLGIVASHGILFTPGATSIRAVAFGEQNAALFDGRTSRVTVAADESQFDFREGDFTAEAWVSTTRGGELFSGYPTAAGDAYHGFRVNVSEEGRVRFAVFNKKVSNSFAASSVATNVADGSWHHLAVVRRSEGVEMYVDGVSVKVNSERKGPGTLDIGGKNALTFGAFAPGAQARTQSHLRGLMREVRLWDVALDAPKLQSRMWRELVGTEPHLLGYWPLDEADISKPRNLVPRHAYAALSEGLRSFATELALDTSAFPYLLEQAELQWPYAGHWSARGEQEVTTRPTLDAASGVLAFGAGNAIYGVHAADGTRAWGKAAHAGTSAPVAAGGVFYAVTGAEGLISIRAQTGAASEVEEFAGLFKALPPAGTRLPAPAADGRYLAAASHEGDVWVLETAKPDAAANAAGVWKWKAPEGAAGDLALAGGRVYLIAGRTLHQLDPAARKSHSVGVAGGPFFVHGDTVFCVRAAGEVVALSAADLTKQRAAFKVPDGSEVMGLVADADENLLVVTTHGGDVYGLTFTTLAMRWTARVPRGTAAGEGGALRAPTLDGRTVFCASASGAVAAFDARSGSPRGLFFEPTEINTAPVVDAGTVYFGCADAPPRANLRDGALHSVVFGHTHVLRLGLDAAGTPEARKGYAEVTSGDVLELLGVEQCCVEAWVNTRAGGEVLSVRPSAKSGYGLRLWLEKDGALNFTCADLPERAGRWQQLRSRAAAARACDGRWHHIAVSRDGREKLTVYLDGVPVEVATVVEEVATPALAEGLKVFIGADATSAAPSNFFTGLVGEVRVWDTYLTATRISQRMHEKLIGNEPDLLAYWNFDVLSVHDGSRNGHDGRLETGGGSSGYWLADLNFTHPSYPYLETAGRLVREGEDEATGPLAETVYELALTARKADGGALARHPVTLWYVRHEGEGGPDAVKVSAPGVAESSLRAVRADHGDEQSLTATTDAHGKTVFRLSTTQRGHGPSLDLRAGFLPANERYHVSVLIDNQKLDKPAPPRLEAQAKLIQDYHWETGDHVDHTRDRSTWRAVITARNSDGTTRPGERLRLWAQAHTEVEVNGRKYSVNPQNQQSFTADQNGELTVALAAKDIESPALSVWAGFMHRDERYTVPLDQEAHRKLAQVEGDDLAKPRMTNWRPDYDPARDDKAVVKKGYEPHKEKVATAVRHVMSVTQEPAGPVRAGRKRAALRADLRNFSDMRQVAPAPRTDGVHTLRTLRHIDRRVPLEPESFRQSLGRVAGFEDSIGFVFEKGDDGPVLSPLKDIPHLLGHFPLLAAAAQAQATPHPELLGNIFEDAWNAVVDAAEAAWEQAKKIAIFITDQVTLVIEYADKVVQKVISSVKEAVAAVAHILEMIEAFIEDVIRILMLLFDWSGIVECHRILKEIGQSQMREVRALTDKGKDEFRKMLAGLFGRTPAPGDLSKHQAGSASANSTRADDPHPQVRGEVNSVHGKYVNSKADEGRDQTSLKADVRPVEPPKNPVEEGTEAEADGIAGALGGALQNPLGGSFGEIFDTVKDLIAGDFEKTITRMWDAAFKDFDKVGQTLDWVNTVLNAEIHIPFVSQLYEWITGGDRLTLLDLSCLALAIPTHVGYGVFTLLTSGEVRRFADDYRAGGGARALQLRAPFSPVAPARLRDGGRENLTATPRNRALHWSYFVFYELYTAYSTGLKITQVARGDEWKKVNDIGLLGALLGVSGLTSKTLLYSAGMTGEEGWNDFDMVWQTALYVVCIGLDIYTCYDATFAEEGGPPGPDWLEKLKQLKRFKDPLKVAASIGGAVLLGLRIEAWVTGKSKESDLFQTRDVLNAVGLMLTFDDTGYFVKAVGPEDAGVVILWEGLIKAAAGCVHIAGVVTE